MSHYGYRHIVLTDKNGRKHKSFLFIGTNCPDGQQIALAATHVFGDLNSRDDKLFHPGYLVWKSSEFTYPFGLEIKGLKRHDSHLSLTGKVSLVTMHGPLNITLEYECECDWNPLVPQMIMRVYEDSESDKEAFFNPLIRI